MEKEIRTYNTNSKTGHQSNQSNNISQIKPEAKSLDEFNLYFY